ncbi:hypothetical protein T4E_11229 [Trichinella pseudospiralis]|uniref:Uncharacterized protein n=1 Tax=Trichinella pseudospiralis TaxID=6337 RepID=A0A0V0XD00_TRIPS|nr:hypothetical protein T4E_11229 [Trichinella pseudospiralis]
MLQSVKCRNETAMESNCYKFIISVALNTSSV